MLEMRLRTRTRSLVRRLLDYALPLAILATIITFYAATLGDKEPAQVYANQLLDVVKLTRVIGQLVSDNVARETILDFIEEKGVEVPPSIYLTVQPPEDVQPALCGSGAGDRGGHFLLRRADAYPVV